MKLPSELVLFFNEAGCGFYGQGAKDQERNRFLINGILGPAEIAAFVCDADDPRRPQCGLDPGQIPFFDMGDRDYLLLNALSDNPNQVLWQDGSLMMNSLVEFFDRLYDHADFYVGGPGTY